MNKSRSKTPMAPTGQPHARKRGRIRLRDMRAFTLIEVQVAIFVFALGILGLLGYSRVNNALIASAEATRSLDGYVDVASERAIVVIASEPGSTAVPACDVRLESIDSSGPYPVVELAVTRSIP